VGWFGGLVIGEFRWLARRDLAMPIGWGICSQWDLGDLERGVWIGIGVECRGKEKRLIG
jgi:hypothetical protein